LDKTQYTDTGIFAYEWIFGSNFISPGGWNQNLAILKRFGVMTTGQKMLDIGVGIGGGARQAASEFGLHVMGVDLSSNMLSIALDRVHRDKDSRVMLVVPSLFFFSSAAVWTVFRTLKPGGKVLMTMYGVGNGALSVAFKQYVANRRYYLRNRDQIRAIATDVGFTNIVVENITDRLKETVMEEKQRVEENKEDFTMFSQAEYEALVSGWNAKLQFIADDNHNWNLFMAAKPQ
uniref:phosphoethanolamine N-methyltransferase n=1 Tax=Angiostrongylus cantonensis TaxID=6313 RepID=A0A0K0CWZ2_ANGCA